MVVYRPPGAATMDPNTIQRQNIMCHIAQGEKDKYILRHLIWDLIHFHYFGLGSEFRETRYICNR